MGLVDSPENSRKFYSKANRKWTNCDSPLCLSYWKKRRDGRINEVACEEEDRRHKEKQGQDGMQAVLERQVRVLELQEAERQIEKREQQKRIQDSWRTREKKTNRETIRTGECT